MRWSMIMTAKSAPTAAARSMDNWDHLQHQQSRMQQNYLRCTYSLYSYFTILSSNALLQRFYQKQDVLSSVDFHSNNHRRTMCCVLLQPQTQSTTKRRTTRSRCQSGARRMIQLNMNINNALEERPIEKARPERNRSSR